MKVSQYFEDNDWHAFIKVCIAYLSVTAYLHIPP